MIAVISGAERSISLQPFSSKSLTWLPDNVFSLYSLRVSLTGRIILSNSISYFYQNKRNGLGVDLNSFSFSVAVQIDRLILRKQLRSWVQLPPVHFFLLYNYGIVLSLFLVIVGQESSRIRFRMTSRPRVSEINIDYHTLPASLFFLKEYTMLLMLEVVFLVQDFFPLC